MRSHSVVDIHPRRVVGPGRAVPPYFPDLNLDQVIGAVLAGREEYDLTPLFATPVQDVATVVYRQQAFRDLDGTDLFGDVRAFADSMRAARRYLAEAAKSAYAHQSERWLLDASVIYCGAVTRLAADLARTAPASPAFQAIGEHLSRLVESDGFRTLVHDAGEAKRVLAGVRYCVHVKGDVVQVSTFDGQDDLSAEVVQTFRRFAQDEAPFPRKLPAEGSGMDKVEARILELVARLHPAAFARLDAFAVRHQAFLDEVVVTFDREVQFYVAYLEHAETFRAAGLPFCYPDVSEDTKEVRARQGYDLALAGQLLTGQAAVVTNDFDLRNPERTMVVTGPNQGGKTTFARMFGQLHHLASIGCPVPASEARLLLFDRIFTHFERQEDLRTHSGKLQEELVRIHAILQQATPRSIIVLNEIFTSTTVEDAVLLGSRVLERVVALDCLCVCVTFVDEWSTLDPTIVSMVSSIDPGDPAVRTFQVIRRPADGLAYAATLAERYGLTYERMKERIAS